MKICRATLWPVRVPLRTPLSTAHGPIAVRDGAVIAIESPDGARGWGEALPLPGFSLESADETRTALGDACAQWVRDGEARLPTRDNGNLRTPAARAALDTALLDLHAHRAGRTFAEELVATQQIAGAEWSAARSGSRITTGVLLPGGPPPAVARAARAAAAAGFRTLKLKLSADTSPLDPDLARIAAVREAAPEARLRLDANAGWSEAEAYARCEALAPFRPELLEQPVAAEDLAGLARVRSQAVFPIAADEAVRDLPSAQRLLDAGAADVLVIKPAAVGGPHAALAIAAKARAAGVEVVVTTFLDAAIGRAAALHVAACIGNGTHDAGLATGEWLASDLCSSPEPRAGALTLPSGTGLALSPKPEPVQCGPVREFTA